MGIIGSGTGGAMKYSLNVFNAETNTKYDYAPVVEKVSYSTTRNNSAGKLSFSYIKTTEDNIVEGAKVTFYVDEMAIFEGYVFTIEMDRWRKVEVTAYDQLRYLKAKASYSFLGKTVGEIIAKISSDFRLNIGTLEDTRYKIPSLTKEDTGCLDIVSYALQLTQNSTGRTFIFFDNAGRISLQEAKNMKATILIGNGSLSTDFKFKSDIDKDTYNQVKLVRPNKETGKADTYIFKDESNIKKWGLLQLYEKVDENLNAAQIADKGKVMMAFYDRVMKSLSISTLGVPGIRAGSMVNFKIANIPELEMGYWLIVDKATHEFSSSVHTMSLEAKILTL